jgi:hypothetical protein
MLCLRSRWRPEAEQPRGESARMRSLSLGGLGPHHAGSGKDVAFAFCEMDYFGRLTVTPYFFRMPASVPS